MAGRNLCAVLLGNPRVDGFLADQAVELLGAKPLAPVTVTFAAIACDASAAKVFWYGQTAQHLGDDVIKRGTAWA